MAHAGRARFAYRALRAGFRDQRGEIRAVRAALRPGDVAVDVGANKGAYTWWMRHAVGPTGRVIAFEPQPEMAAYLRDARAAMGWDNVEVREAAASDRSGRATLRVPGGGPSQGASLEAGAVSGAHREIPCAVERLDDALAGAARIALMKIDVEGHELAVFRGAAGILARDHPVLLFECEMRHLDGKAPAGVFRFLVDLGYSGSFFSPAGERPLVEFDPSVHQRCGPGPFWKAPGYVNNFLFRATRGPSSVFQ
jgi:FkbM family methyltransferase